MWNVQVGPGRFNGAQQMLDLFRALYPHAFVVGGTGRAPEEQKRWSISAFPPGRRNANMLFQVRLFLPHRAQQGAVKQGRGRTTGSSGGGMFFP